MQPHRFLAEAAALIAAALVFHVDAQAQNCPPNTFQTTQTYTNSFAPAPPPWSGLVLTLPKFQPGPGETLLKAEITATGTASGSVQAENLSQSGGQNLSWALASALQVQIPVPGQPPLLLAPSINGNDSLTTYDGTTDFGGTSGVSHFSLFDDDTQSATITDPTVLQNVFTGAGTLDFTHSAADSSSHNGGGNLVIVILNTTGLTISVRYTVCTPVPPNFCHERNRRNCGSLLLYPEFDNSQATLTLVTITNACCDDDSDGTWVEFRYIDKDTCFETNFSQHLSPCDTFSFMTSAMNPNGTQGYLYAYAKRNTQGSGNNPSGVPWVFNRLIGQELIINGITTLDYSMNAVSFRGIGADKELNDDDGDGIRDLNGPDAANPEYEEAPDQILIPRFLGQDSPNRSAVAYNSQLILIGLSGGTQFTTLVSVLGYNDNEDPQSSQYSFHCWAKPYLREVAPFTLESYLDALPTNAPGEIGGASFKESGWLRLDGLVANSSGPEAIQNPAIYAVLVERAGGYAVADLPFEYCSQTNGDLIPTSIFGDGPNPVAGDNQ